MTRPPVKLMLPLLLLLTACTAEPTSNLSGTASNNSSAANFMPLPKLPSPAFDSPTATVIIAIGNIRIECESDYSIILIGKDGILGIRRLPPTFLLPHIRNEPEISTSFLASDQLVVSIVLAVPSFATAPTATRPDAPGELIEFRKALLAKGGVPFVGIDRTTGRFTGILTLSPKTAQSLREEMR